jgi:drug/metabolite transporter (DMT)-like permease
MLSILNATSPLWGALVAAALATRAAGRTHDLGGTCCSASPASACWSASTASPSLPGAGIAIAASLAAALCYAVAGNYAKSAREVAPFANAHGSMWAASLLMAPVLLAFPPTVARGDRACVALRRGARRSCAAASPTCCISA